MSATNFSPFIRRLSALGFTIEADTRGKFNGREMSLSRERDGRVVGVQLWSRGPHRAFHSIAGCSDTMPTEFADVVGMLAAVEREQARMDSAYVWRLPGALTRDRRPGRGS